MTDNLVGFITVYPHKPIMKAYAARRLAAKDRDGLADPEDIAIELGIGLYEVTELVRRYQDSFDWASVPIGKAAAPLRTGDPSPDLLLLRRLEGYYRQLADRVELFPHCHMLVFAPDARSLVTGYRLGNSLGDIAGK